MEGICHNFKDALPQKLDSRKNVQKVELCLKTTLKALQDVGSDDKCLDLLKTGIIYLISEVTNLLQHSMPIKHSNNILNLILDSLFAASENGSKSNSFVVTSISIKLLDIVFEAKFPFLSRIEVLNKLNLIFESTDIGVKERFVQTEPCKSKLKSLFQLVLDVGDYEFQVCLVEFLFRLLPRKLRQKVSRDFIEDPNVLKAFLAVRDNCFEVDCRKFLNGLNQDLGENRKVYSFPCEKITFGFVELQKPCDEGYNDFWIDLNLGSKRIIVFCENAQLSSQASSNDDCWDTVSVWQDDVRSFVCEEQDGQLHTRMHVKASASCVPSAWGSQSRPTLHVITDQLCDMERILVQMFDKKKMSDANSPIACFTETDNASQEVNYSEDESEHEAAEEGAAGPSVNTTRIQDSPSSTCTRSSLKISEPSFRMATPASFINVESICQKLEEFENAKKASSAQTPKSRVTKSKRKVKTPVVTMVTPAPNPPNTNTRKTPKTKFVPPPSADNATEIVEPDAGEEGNACEESSSNTVIPDSMPPQPQAETTKPPPRKSQRSGTRKDSGISVKYEEGKEKQNALLTQDSSGQKSETKQPRSSKRQQNAQETTNMTPARTLRNSQKKNLASDLQPELPSQSQKSRKIKSGKEQSVDKNNRTDISSSVTEAETTVPLPSSFEEFKAPKSRKSSQVKTTKPCASSSKQKQNISDSQRSCKRAVISESEMSQNSTDDEKLHRANLDRKLKKKKTDQSSVDNVSSYQNEIDILNGSSNDQPEIRVTKLVGKTKQPESSLVERNSLINVSDDNVHSNNSTCLAANPPKDEPIIFKQPKGKQIVRSEDKTSKDTKLPKTWGGAKTDERLVKAKKLKENQPQKQSNTSDAEDEDGLPPHRMDSKLAAENRSNPSDDQNQSPASDIENEFCFQPHVNPGSSEPDEMIEVNIDGSSSQVIEKQRPTDEDFESQTIVVQESDDDDDDSLNYRFEIEDEVPENNATDKCQATDENKSSRNIPPISSKPQVQISQADSSSWKKKSNVDSEAQEETLPEPSQKLQRPKGNLTGDRTGKDLNSIETTPSYKKASSKPKSFLTELSPVCESDDEDAAYYQFDIDTQQEQPLNAANEKPPLKSTEKKKTQEAVAEQASKDPRKNERKDLAREAESKNKNQGMKHVDLSEGENIEESDSEMAPCKSSEKKKTQEAILKQAPRDPKKNQGKGLAREVESKAKNQAMKHVCLSQDESNEESDSEMPPYKSSEKKKMQETQAQAPNASKKNQRKGLAREAERKSHKQALKHVDLSQDESNEESEMPPCVSERKKTQEIQAQAPNAPKKNQRKGLAREAESKSQNQAMKHADLSQDETIEESNSMPPLKSSEKKKTQRAVSKQEQKNPQKDQGKGPAKEADGKAKNPSVKHAGFTDAERIEESESEMEETEHSNLETSKNAFQEILKQLSGQKSLQQQSETRNLRKRQPKSYKEQDESFEDLDVSDIHSAHNLQRQAKSRSTVSDKRFVFTQEESKMLDHRKKFVQKTFTMSISSTLEKARDRNSSDPYEFDEEEHTTTRQICNPAHVSANKTLGKLSSLRKKGKLATPKSATFSWDDDSDNNNDADEELSQDNEEAAHTSVLSSRNKKSLSPIKFMTPDPRYARSDEDLDQKTQHRLFFSQRKFSRLDDPLKSQRKSCENLERKKENPGQNKKAKGKPKKSKEDAVYDASTIEEKSEISWIARHKAPVEPDPKTKKTYKRKPANHFSPENPGLAFNRNKKGERKTNTDFAEKNSELDSLSSSPEQQRVRAPPRRLAKQMYSPLDITLGTSRRLTGAGDFSDHPMRSSVRNKLPNQSGMGDSGSEIDQLGKPSLSLALPNKSRNRSQKKAVEPEFIGSSQESAGSEELQAVAESSPPQLRLSLSKLSKGKDAPIKRPYKATKKVQLSMPAEAEVDDLNNDSAFVSGPSTIMRPSRSVLKRMFPDCSGLASEDDEEDRSQGDSSGSQSDKDKGRAAKRPCLQSRRELFPQPMETSLAKAKTQPKKKQPAKQAQPKGSSKQTKTLKSAMEILENVSDDKSDDMPAMGATAPSHSTDDFLSQAERELGVEHPTPQVTTLLKGFGFNLQQRIKERQNQVQELTKNMVKLSSKRLDNLWSTEKSKRDQVLNGFRDHIQAQLVGLEQDIAGLSDIEKKAETMYVAQLKMLRDQREKLQRRLNSVKEQHNNFRAEAEQVETNTHQSRKNLETLMKKDMERLRNKMLLEMQEQQLRRVKDSFQKHLL